MNNSTFPMVTIGIPTFNRADGYLKQALQSALNQTYSNLDIIVSDNCSKDNTEKVVRGFSDSRIRYYRQKENIGPNNNFNFCLKQAKGDYFLLLQDDDMIDQDFVETCMKNAGYDTKFGIIRTGTRLIESQGNVLFEIENKVEGLSFEDFILGWFRDKTSWYLCSTLFNTTKLRAIGGFQSKRNLLQDGVAIAQLASKYDRVDVQDVKASFRKHGDEITFAVRVNDWAEDFLALLDMICELAVENKSLLRNEGQRFFAGLSYKRTSAVQSPIKRLITYITIFRKFHYKYLPPPVRRFTHLPKKMLDTYNR